MLFSEFSQFLTRLEQTASRLEMTAILAELFKKLEPTEVPQASYLLEGRLVPQYQSLEFQLSATMMLRALARIASQEGSATMETSLFGETDLSAAEALVLKKYKTLGDIGRVAEEVTQKNEAKSEHVRLTITQVYDRLTEIARAAGEGSQEQKVAQVVSLLEQLDPLSNRYVSKVIVGKLRLGFATMTLLDGLSWSMTGTKEESGLLETAYQKKADIGKLAQVYLSHENEVARHTALEEYTVEVGIPVSPQLCQILGSADEVVEKMTEVFVEPKYDGLRVQIHIKKSGENGKTQIKVFTRNLEDASHMFPELEQLVPLLQADSVILDGEAIGYDPVTGKLMLFQETITRKRKHDIAETAKTVPLKFFIFDVLAIDNKPLLQVSLQERKKLLKDLFNETEQFTQTSYITTSNPKELQNYHNLQLAEGLEGVVIKQVNSPYQSGRKGWYWVKMKQAEGEAGKLRDTLDCVVMGYYVGRGKRTAFGIGAFLVGILTSEKTVVTIAKIGTGISDEQLRDLKNRCDALKTESQPAGYLVSKIMIPDVWIEPQLVVEVAADEITRSPQHTAGLALRFPRLVKIRDDKAWEDATTLPDMQQMMG